MSTTKLQRLAAKIEAETTFTEALDALNHANMVGDSLALAVAWADLKAAYRAHVTALHLGETVDGRAA